MALHKIKDLIQDESYFFDTYIDVSEAWGSLFYNISKELENYTFTDIDNVTWPMDFLKQEPYGSGKSTGTWLNCLREYVEIYSKDKILSDYAEKVYSKLDAGGFYEDPEDETAQGIAKAYMNILARIIVNKYKDNWFRAWYALSVKYRPADNYDRTEVIDRDTDTTNTIATFTDDWNTNKQGATTTAATTYGFNSSTGVPTGTTTVTPSNNISATNTSIPGSQNAINESSTHNHGTDTINTDEDSTVKIHGNIGVTTTQQMLESEMEFREKYNFYNMLYNDLDKILTCSCFGTMEDIGEI